MRPLVIDDAVRTKVAIVVAHAQAHPYRPGPDSPIPGDDPKHVVKLGTYRAVFTFTETDGALWRHLSISIPEKFPNPAAVFLIAHTFGFTGYNPEHINNPGSDWLFDLNERDRCIVLVQPIRSLIPKEKCI